MAQPHLVDHTGQRIGKWRVIDKATCPNPNSCRSSKAHWLCECECGTRRVIPGVRLRNGRSLSCGCDKQVIPTGVGMNEDGVWRGMIHRCTNPLTDSYPRYGGRGITVCERWTKSFAAFFADMGPRPSKQHTLDRIDNDGNYEPGNCRWTTWDVQARNRTNTVFVEWEGRKVKLADLLAERGVVKRSLVYLRLYAGMTLEEALTSPPGKKGRERKYTPRAEVEAKIIALDSQGVGWFTDIPKALAAAGMRLTKDNPISRETVRRVLFKHKSALTTPTNP